MAKDAATRAARTEKLGAAIVEFEPLPFDGSAARYGTFVGLTIEMNRDPRPRRMDLMIAAIASAHGLPLYTRNADDLVGLATFSSSSRSEQHHRPRFGLHARAVNMIGVRRLTSRGAPFRERLALGGPGQLVSRSCVAWRWKSECPGRSPRSSS
jgi:hypothetical protein